MKKKTRALIWFTKDLRIHDNPLLENVQKNSVEVMALLFEKTIESSLNKDFYFQSAREIKENFSEHGIFFLILKGEPAEEIPKWVKLNSIDFVLTQNPFNSRDRDQLEKLEKALLPGQVKKFFGQTLLSRNQLPYKISELPMIFTDFRKKIELIEDFGPPLSTSLKDLTGFEPDRPIDSIPMNFFDSDVNKKFPFELLPGESGGLVRLSEYFEEAKSVSKYKSTRNGMIAKNDSSKFSLYLSCGCLSPKMIHSKLRHYEERHGSNESTKWFFYELLWRDYFKFLALKVEEKLFSANGLVTKEKKWNVDAEAFQKWCDGKTGADFIDANMTELRLTGWMSNRGRQNVASYLAKTMKLDWTLGAKYFEQKLIDFDTESNWGNWIYIAGVGTDPRDRVFNYQRQAEIYDPDHRYRKMWLGLVP